MSAVTSWAGDNKQSSGSTAPPAPRATAPQTHTQAPPGQGRAQTPRVTQPQVRREPQSRQQPQVNGGQMQGGARPQPQFNRQQPQISGGVQQPGGRPQPHMGRQQSAGGVAQPNMIHNQPPGGADQPARNNSFSTHNGSSNRVVPGNAGFHPGEASPVRQPRELGGPNGAVMHTDMRGNVREVRGPGYTVVRGPGGVRRIEAERNGKLFVTDRYGHGYAQQHFMYHGQEFAHRTYYVNGRPYVNVYRPYMYHNRAVYVYAPMHYYRPAFYVYAYRPWPRPVVYRWGWYSEPWYVYYRPYFAPYAAYPSPAFWLTDYVIAANLQAAYQEQVNQQEALAGPAMDLQIKQAVAIEVQRQLEAEQQLASTQGATVRQDPGPGDGLPILDNTVHTLVVTTSMNVTNEAGDCAITQGDVLQFSGSVPDGQDPAQVLVMWSKGSDCSASSHVLVPVDQLQEMQNQMRANLDQGLAQIQSGQGQNGLPKLPQDAVGSTEADYAFQAPPPEPNIAEELKQGTVEGMQLDRETPTQVNDASYQLPQQTPPTGSCNVNQDQSPADVIAMCGPPVEMVNAGPKTILIYSSLKLTFVNNKLKNIE